MLLIALKTLFQQMDRYSFNSNSILRLCQATIWCNIQFLIVIPNFPQRSQFTLPCSWSIHVFCNVDKLLLIYLRSDKYYKALDIIGEYVNITSENDEISECAAPDEGMKMQLGGMSAPKKKCRNMAEESERR